MTVTNMLERLQTWAEAQARRLEPVAATARRWKNGVYRNAARLAGTGLVFLALIAFWGLPWPAAAAGLLIIAAVMISGDEVPEDEGHGGALPGHPGEPLGDGRREGRDYWRALLDAIPEPALVLDGLTTVMHHNGLVHDLYSTVRAGYPLRHMSRNPELNDAVDKAMTSPEPIVVQLYERVPVERRISATISRLAGAREKKGQPSLLVTFRDLTEQDRLAQMRADFIANASHELRTPLASLRGFVETLQGPARDDPQARDRFLAIMASQATRMTRLIDDLLSLSRVEMRVHLPPKGVVDLNEIASYVAQALEPLAEASKVELKVKKLGGPARIRGDRDEIVQVIQNLAHNALKYGRENGHVEIAISRVLDGSPPAERLLIAVADDGPGIAPEHLPRLTERFYRANVATSRDKGGTGLGLAIVKHIVIRHRGELRIASEVGKGSTFSIFFDEIGSKPAI